MYLAIPTVLILINSLSVKVSCLSQNFIIPGSKPAFLLLTRTQWYGWFEVVMGSSKMAFLLVIIISLIVFLAEGG